MVIVLGCAVWPGECPSHALLRRSRKAARLWHQGGVDLIIASGGIGAHPPSEAEVIRRILLKEGVPDQSILKEDRSTSTLTNARFSLALLRSAENNAKTTAKTTAETTAEITVVTDGYHRLRAGLIFRDQGTRARIISADDCPPYPRIRVQTKLAMREIAALGRYMFWRGRKMTSKQK